MPNLFVLSLFFLSYSPLWISVLFMDVKNILIDKDDHIITEIILIGTISFLWILAFVYLCCKVNGAKNSDEETYTLVEAKENKTITADFFLSYILPLFAFDFTQWDGVVEFLIFFSVLAFLSLRHNHFSVNIVLELMNYRMYESVLRNSDDQEIEKIVISKKPLSVCKGEVITVNHINNDFVQMIE